MRLNLIPTATLVAFFALAPVSLAQDWTQVTDMPGQGRHHPVNFTLDGYGYVVTGATTGSSYTDDFYRYDPGLDAWEVLPDFPGRDRCYAYGGAYGGKGYLGFGSSGFFSYLADLWEYDPATENWTQLASLPGTARTHPAFVITDDGKIFVGMGGARAGNLKDWWEYDIASDTWTQKANLPGANRHHPYYFNIGDTPYVGFGHGNSIYKDVYAFDRSSESWVQMANFPGEGRVAGQQFSHGGKGYIISGDNEQHSWFPTGEFHEYDPDTDTWTPMPFHPGSSRWAPGTFVIDNALFFMAGLSTVQLEKTVWTFELDEACDLAVAVSDYPSSISRGGTVNFTAAVSNSCDETLRFDEAIMAVTGPASVDQSLYDGNLVPVRSGNAVSAPVSVFVPQIAPLGTYLVEVTIYRNGSAIDSDVFEIDVTN